MKAIFARIVIYIGTFFVAIQGASNSPVQAAQHETAKPSVRKAIDPQKDSDIRSLLELIGARDMIQEAANNSTEQYRQKLISLAPNDDKSENGFHDLPTFLNIGSPQGGRTRIIVRSREIGTENVKGQACPLGDCTRGQG